jgi:hypothetical protein
MIDGGAKSAAVVFGTSVIPAQAGTQFSDLDAG